MADANNGYQNHHEWAFRFLKECSPYGLSWIEEIFPETLSDYENSTVSYRKSMQIRLSPKRESVRNMDEFAPFLKAGL